MGSSCMWIIIFFLAFFLEKVLLICFNLLYVVMFLFLAKLYVVMLKLLCCVLLLKRSVPLFGIFVIISIGFPYLFFFSFFLDICELRNKMLEPGALFGLSFYHFLLTHWVQIILLFLSLFVS